MALLDYASINLDFHTIIDNYLIYLPSGGGKVDIPQVDVLLSINKKVGGGEGELKQQVPSTLTPTNVATPPASVKAVGASSPSASLRPTGRFQD